MKGFEDFKCKQDKNIKTLKNALERMPKENQKAQF